MSKENKFRNVFSLCYEPLCFFIFRLVGDMEVAREIAQETFLKLWDRGEFDHPAGVIRSFLYRVAHNEAIDYIRKDNRYSRYRQEIMATRTGYTDSLSNSILYNELKENIENYIKDLPPRTQEVFLLSRVDGLTNKAIATQLEISVKSVEGHITKAIKELKEQYNRDYPKK